MNQADFAELLGLSRNAITQWKKRGLVVLQGKLVDVEATFACIRANHRGGADIVTAARAKLASRGNGDASHRRSDAAGDKVTNDVAGPATVTRGGDDPFPHRDHLTDPHDRAAVALLPLTAYRIGGVAALSAYELGMAPEVAERLRSQVACSAMEIVCMILQEADVPPPPGETTWSDVAMFDPDKVAVVAWTMVA